LTKPKRIVNRELLDSYHEKPCAARPPCVGQIVAHHIKSKGAGGDDIESNLMPVCVRHHRMIHELGIKKMLAKYPELRQYLKNEDQ
jgi:hypothetical protein